MPLSLITAQAVPCKTGVALMARIFGQGGAYITQASLTSANYGLQDLTLGVQVDTAALTIASVVFDNLQQSDGLWTKDSAASPGVDGAFGYCFRYIVPSTKLLNPSRYHADVNFVPVSGYPFVVQFEWHGLKVYL